MVNWVVSSLISFYDSLISSLPAQYADMIIVFIFAALISFYAIFTWKFYRFLSKKDLIDINLSRYNTLTQPFFKKLLAAGLYLIEYIIVLPFLIFFWFGVLAILILVLSEELLINQVVIVAAAMVAAIRMLSYYEEDLSKDLAKMFPFTILAIFILSPGFFSLERVLTNLIEIPNFIGNILSFLVLIIGLELILRILDLLKNLLISEKDSVENIEA